MATTQLKNGFQGGSDDQAIVHTDGSLDVNIVGVTPGLPIGVDIHDSNGATLLSDGTGALRVNPGQVTTDLAGLNAFQTSQYDIITTAVQLAPTPLTNRSSIAITVIADPNVAVYVGNSSAVTTANGYPLFNGSSIQLDLTPSGQIWAITDTPTQRIAVMEIA